MSVDIFNYFIYMGREHHERMHHTSMALFVQIWQQQVLLNIDIIQYIQQMVDFNLN